MHCWGDGSSGQFGLLKSENVFLPTPGAASVQISNISCGEQHTLFLIEDGTVLSCGRNSKGQLGRQRERDSNVPSRVEGLGGVVAVACGRDHSVAVTASGQVLCWGAGGDGQLGINLEALSKVPRPRPALLPEIVQVVQVACGDSHSLALTTGGMVFSWGLNSHGQLGLGKGVSLQPVPHPVQSLTGVPVTQVAAGGAHTMVLTLPGLVYCCGANKAGQLGLNRVDDKGRFNLCAVPALRPLGVSFISCGESHTAVLDMDGRVFTFGEGSRGQLGHNSTANELRPRLVDGLGGTASQITCGSHHTLVLGSSGQLWAFGSGVKGQLGTGSPQDSLQPIPVPLPWESDQTATPNNLRIAAGWNSSFILSAAKGRSVPKSVVGRLDEAKLQKWLSMKTGNAEAKREISLMFSGSASLVASFTKVRESQSTMTAGTLTVDIEEAERVLEQLLDVPWIKQSLNLEPLVGNLTNYCPVLKSPEVFLLLPLCSLLHEDRSIMTLVLALAVGLWEMNEASKKTLKDWLFKLTPSVMTKHILMWKQALNFMLRCNLLATHNRGVKFMLQALKDLYRANKRAGESQRLPISTFYVDEVANHVNLHFDWVAWHHWSKIEDTEQTPAIFCRYPFVLNLLYKIAVFNFSATTEKMTHHVVHQMSEMWPSGTFPEIPESVPAPVFQLKLRRTHLVEDTLRQLDSADHCAFQRELLVQFVEDMKITAVNKRDFFLHIFQELLQSEMFMYNGRQTMVWFSAEPQPTEEKRYFLFGVLCGMALYNHNFVHLPFPLALFKKLVNVKPSLDDMIEFEPIVGGSLHYILVEYADSDVENMDMTYLVHWGNRQIELDPKEPGKHVTSANKKEFVDAYVSYAFNQSVERAFEEFKRGFFKVCNRNVVDLFQPEELRGVMVGTEDYDWETLRQNCVYQGEYHDNHPNIRAFWEVFEGLTANQMKAFLLFITGCDRVPILGMGQIIMKVAPLRKSTEHHFPEALTCHFLLLLPIYQSNEILQARLVEALNHNRGFWKE